MFKLTSEIILNFLKWTIRKLCILLNNTFKIMKYWHNTLLSLIMRISVLNHIFALSRNFCLIAIITGWSFYLLSSRNADTNPLSVAHRKVENDSLRESFFCLFLEKRGSVHYRREERTERTREATSALPHRPHRSDKLSGRVFSNTRLLSQFDNFYIHSHSPGYANFQFVVLLQ